ncbi:B32 [Murid betaherpesvirus 8]|uniref:B32 n=1 Tax=Rat cytomegalovirus (isolate England) TaxID=1261657 RepID=A0A0E3SWN2_RCMVE|nr:B32 [Murid betaherpesvirus 8]WPH24948.1 B32 [Murid betaherpesvirus 8]WPH25082.1 B32 [Murid betaherpesvirus 8]
MGTLGFIRLSRRAVRRIKRFLDNFDNAQTLNLCSHDDILTEARGHDLSTETECYNELILWLRYLEALLSKRPTHLTLLTNIRQEYAKLFTFVLAQNELVAFHGLSDIDVLGSAIYAEDYLPRIDVFLDGLHSLCQFLSSKRFGRSDNMGFVGLRPEEVNRLMRNVKAASENLINYELLEVRDVHNEDPHIICLNRLVYLCRLAYAMTRSWKDLCDMCVNRINMLRRRLVVSLQDVPTFSRVYFRNALENPVDHETAHSLLRRVEEDFLLIKNALRWGDPNWNADSDAESSDSESVPGIGAEYEIGEGDVDKDRNGGGAGIGNDSEEYKKFINRCKLEDKFYGPIRLPKYSGENVRESDSDKPSRQSSPLRSPVNTGQSSPGFDAASLKSDQPYHKSGSSSPTKSPSSPRSLKGISFEDEMRREEEARRQLEAERAEWEAQEKFKKELDAKMEKVASVKENHGDDSFNVTGDYVTLPSSLSSLNAKKPGRKSGGVSLGKVPKIKHSDKVKATYKSRPLKPPEDEYYWDDIEPDFVTKNVSPLHVEDFEGLRLGLEGLNLEKSGPAEKAETKFKPVHVKKLAESPFVLDETSDSSGITVIQNEEPETSEKEDNDVTLIQ